MWPEGGANEAVWLLWSSDIVNRSSYVHLTACSPGNFTYLLSFIAVLLTSFLIGWVIDMKLSSYGYSCCFFHLVVVLDLVGATLFNRSLTEVTHAQENIVQETCTKYNTALFGASFWYSETFKHSRPIKPHNFGHVHRCKLLVKSFRVTLVISNWIGVKFGRIVIQVNMHWLTVYLLTCAVYKYILK